MLCQPTLTTTQTFVGTVWPAVQAAGGPTAAPLEYQYFPQALEPDWVAGTPLPLDEARVVTLAGHDGFERLRPGQVAAAHEAQPRTKIYGEFHTGWIAMAGQYLMELSRYQVVFTAYESTPDDETMGPHTDDWLVVATQWQGEKAWWLGQQACEQGDAPTLTTHTGDILVIPKGYPHDARTFTSRGSLHLAVGVRLNKPIGQSDHDPVAR